MSASMRGLIILHRSSSTLQIVGILPFCFAILALLSLDYERIIGIRGRFEIVSIWCREECILWSDLIDI